MFLDNNIDSDFVREANAFGTKESEAIESTYRQYKVRSKGYNSSNKTVVSSDPWQYGAVFIVSTSKVEHCLLSYSRGMGKKAQKLLWLWF